MRRLLIRLYPTKWREEYGAEFADVLAQRSVRPGVIADIAWSALRQRLRYEEPWKVAGVALALMKLTFLGLNICAPWSYEVNRIVVYYVPAFLLPLVFGCWVVLREGTRVNHGGREALKAWLLASTPLLILFVVFGTQALPIEVVGPGDIPHSTAFHYYNSAPQSPSLWKLAGVSLLPIPSCWMWGTLGGVLGQRLLKRREVVR